jgi:hypothetical protein
MNRECVLNNLRGGGFQKTKNNVIRRDIDAKG